MKQRWENSKYKFRQAIASWSDLTPEQAIAWNKFGRTFRYKNKKGIIVSKRGIDIFKSVNRTRLEVGEPVILDPPPKIFPMPFISVEVDILVSEIFDDMKVIFKPAIRKDTKYIVYATHPLQPGVFSPKPFMFKEIAVLDYKFRSGDSILKNYYKVLKFEGMQKYRIHYIFKPVSVISGLTAKPSKVFEYSY